MRLLTFSFGLGLQAALPVLGSLVIAAVAVGVLGRLLPQLNVLAIGAGINSLVALGVLFLSLGSMAYSFQDQLALFLDSLLECIQLPG